MIIRIILKIEYKELVSIIFLYNWEKCLYWVGNKKIINFRVICFFFSVFFYKLGLIIMFILLVV